MATRDPARVPPAELDGVIEIGASPRATLGLVAAARALALMRGRDYVLPEDVARVARRRDGAPARADLRRGRRRRRPRGVIVERIVDAVPPPRPVWNSTAPRRTCPLTVTPPPTAARRPVPLSRARPGAGAAPAGADRSPAGSTGFLHGEHLGLLPGPGTELAEARLYQPGEDDVRRMDWAVTARTTVPHVRDVIADRELETWALVDLSPSMDFGTARLEKRDLAVAAVATIGFLTIRVGDRFGGYVLHDGRMRRWPARVGPARAVRRCCSRCWESRP